MAGWSMIESSLKTKLRSWFDRFHSSLLREICSVRPVPALLGDSGRGADLFSLFVSVHNKGGFEAVSRAGLWASVAEESGLKRGLAVAVKLVYVKYLDGFERWLDRVGVESEEDCLFDIQDEFNGFVSEIKSRRLMGSWDSESVDSDTPSRKRKKSSDDEDNDGLVVDLETEENEEEWRIGREKLLGIVDWVKGVARDPCDVSVGSLPEPLKWRLEENSGAGEDWKKVLLAREGLFRKRDGESEQKNQKMHPSMYNDQSPAYNLRERLSCRQKLSNGKPEKPGSPSPATSELDRTVSGLSDSESLIDKHSPSHVPTGSKYQAQVPEWTGMTFESDPKWLGTRVWPLERPETRFLLERDPIGKGRQTSCGCENPGSVDCVRFHVAEKRLRLKRELSSAFYLWRFNKMGEEVTMFFTKTEQKKFDEIVASNPPLSFGSGFWDRIYSVFRSKSRADLVSYYYNVFVLRRRAHQNRFTPGSIDSDDEDLEQTSASTESSETKKPVLLSPKKHK